MAKYGKYTGGQWEALGNILGGETVLDGLLRGEVEFVIVSAKKPTTGTVMVTCAAVNNRDCNICHTMFGDSADDTVCAGGHVIGQQYEVPA